MSDPSRPSPSLIKAPGTAPLPEPYRYPQPQPPYLHEQHLQPQQHGPPPHLQQQPYPPQQQFVGTQVAVGTQQSSVEIIVAWVFTVLTGLYMLPWAIAATRRTSNSVLIAVGTFFLGWTVVGWLVFLVLACVGGQSVVTVTSFSGPVPLPAGQWAHCQGDPANVRRWWTGSAWTSHTTLA